MTLDRTFPAASLNKLRIQNSESCRRRGWNPAWGTNSDSLEESQRMKSSSCGRSSSVIAIITPIQKRNIKGARHLVRPQLFVMERTQSAIPKCGNTGSMNMEKMLL